MARIWGATHQEKSIRHIFLAEKLNVSIMVDEKQIEILKRVIILDNENGVEVGVVGLDNVPIWVGEPD